MSADVPLGTPVGHGRSARRKGWVIMAREVTAREWADTMNATAFLDAYETDQGKREAAVAHLSPGKQPPERSAPRKDPKRK